MKPSRVPRTGDFAWIKGRLTLVFSNAFKHGFEALHGCGMGGGIISEALSNG